MTDTNFFASNAPQKQPHHFPKGLGITLVIVVTLGAIAVIYFFVARGFKDIDTPSQEGTPPPQSVVDNQNDRRGTILQNIDDGNSTRTQTETDNMLKTLESSPPRQ